ncbi:hypothetical protein SERLA73DRAFT_155893 [Serpula lacrymans var. lacrymans S7.3]|uniref:Uncharacterized protein n=1 Tax=Serpula lacrymans var. lacrymans (strain S7.3) TaxID=936435 RepID=F8QC17_SERL3|nr:hypothetical protein SERLA73DRAFT_155893 [Serpula lacrymans var. lacrymans S7.3]
MSGNKKCYPNIIDWKHARDEEEKKAHKRAKKEQMRLRSAMQDSDIGLPQEEAACGRRAAAILIKKPTVGLAQDRTAQIVQSGPKQKKLNLTTYKYHALGGYPSAINNLVPLIATQRKLANYSIGLSETASLPETPLVTRLVHSKRNSKNNFVGQTMQQDACERLINKTSQWQKAALAKTRQTRPHLVRTGYQDYAFKCETHCFIDHNMFMQYQGDGVSHKATRGWDSFLQKESHHRARHKAGGDKQDLEYNIQGSEEDPHLIWWLGKAMWPDKDQALLIDYIIENWKEVCPGQTLQKDFWNKVVAHLAPHHIIKTTYKSLKGLINHGSNIHHDLSTGLTITAESKTQWNDFVKQYPLVAAHAFRTPEVITTGAAVSVTLAPASTTIIAHPSGQSAGSNFTARIAPRIPLSTPSGSTAGPAIPSNTPNVVGDWLGDLPSPSSILPPPSSSVRSGMSVSSKGSKGKRREHQPDTVSVSISHVTTSTGTGLDTSSAMSISSWTSKNPRILAMNKLCGVLNNHLTNIVLAILDIRDAVKKEQQVLNHTKEMLDASTAAPILLPPNVPRTNPTSIPSTRSTAAPAALATPTIAEIADTNATCLQLALWHLHKHDRHLPMQVLLHIVELFKSDTTMVELCLAMSQWDKLCCLWLESFIYGV